MQVFVGNKKKKWMEEDPSSLGAVSIKWEKGNSFRTGYEYTLNYLENKDFVTDTSTLKKMV